MTRRLTTQQERDEFAAAFAETRPLAARKEKAPLLSKEQAKVPKGGGLDGRTAERLRRGLVEPEARLDLHGFTEDSAHATLLKFIRTQRGHGARLVLVVTGRGARRDEDGTAPLWAGRGVLRKMVPRWLEEPEFATYVVSSATAHRRHGGEGALYVYLRKSRT